MSWIKKIVAAFEWIGRTLFAGLFLRVGPCHFDFEVDRAGRGGAALE